MRVRWAHSGQTIGWIDMDWTKCTHKHSQVAMSSSPKCTGATRWLGLCPLVEWRRARCSLVQQTLLGCLPFVSSTLATPQLVILCKIRWRTLRHTVAFASSPTCSTSRWLTCGRHTFRVCAHITWTILWTRGVIDPDRPMTR